MFNTRRASAALLCFALSAGLAATRTAPSARAARTPAKVAKQRAISDAELEKAIRERFAASKISRHHFQVHVQGGVATIEGQTDVLQHKGTATRLAKNAGATKVINRVVVSEAAKEKAARNLAAGRRRAQIKRSETTARSAKRSL